MGLLGGRKERKDERRGVRTFRMRQKLVSIGDDYWIEDDQGERVYKINGKALRVRETLILEDTHGGELYKIQSNMLRASFSEVYATRAWLIPIRGASYRPTPDRRK